MDESIVYYDIVFDRHVFSYFSIGYDEKGSVDELVVITIPKTNEIITMYPTKGYKIKNIETPVVKKKSIRLSQIEKFK